MWNLTEIQDQRLLLGHVPEVKYDFECCANTFSTKNRNKN